MQSLDCYDGYFYCKNFTLRLIIKKGKNQVAYHLSKLEEDTMLKLNDDTFSDEQVFGFITGFDSMVRGLS